MGVRLPPWQVKVAAVAGATEPVWTPLTAYAPFACVRARLCVAGCGRTHAESNGVANAVTLPVRPDKRELAAGAAPPARQRKPVLVAERGEWRDNIDRA